MAAVRTDSACTSYDTISAEIFAQGNLQLAYENIGLRSSS